LVNRDAALDEQLSIHGSPVDAFVRLAVSVRMGESGSLEIAMHVEGKIRSA
jgi:hypothetical protein